MSCGLDICYCQSNSIIYNILYCFNTSHVTLYLKREEFFESLETSFNTSHVTLYRTFVLLFLFSICFNTSHVTLYPKSREDRLSLLLCFNTSHVTLYPCSLRATSLVSKRFNTSHVTLYRRLMKIFHLHSGAFQYISCYSLSRKKIGLD